MTAAVETSATRSPVTERAVAFVAGHKPVAEALGTSLADLINEPEAFAEALGKALADPAEAARRGAAALRSARERYGIDTMVRRHEAFYAEVTGLGAHGRAGA